MHLKRLEVQGFKTFAGRTVLEFRPGITAVVGPNGSGKSNLVDAVRWVLGEQSYSALRCRRTEELLFSGGGRRPPAGFAEVSLTIDNSDRLLPLAFDEVTITRRATRAGENEYFINRARVRLRDLQEATEPLGGSYTIINQGLVDQVLTLRPEERRRLFEDAAEIGGYEMRKTEAERRLRETDGNVRRIADLTGELEPRLRSLKRQAAETRRQRELTAELQQLLEQHYTAQWHTTRRALAIAGQQVDQQTAALEQARTNQSRITTELRTLRDALRGQRERLGELHQRSSLLHTQAETAQRDLAVTGERLAALTQRTEELERTRNDLELRQAEAEQERATAEAALAAAETTLHEQQTQLAAHTSAMADLETARRELAQELTRAQDAALKAATVVAEGRSRAEQQTAQRTRLQQEQADLEAGQQQADERLAAAQQRVETARAAVAQAKDTQAAAAQEEATARDGLKTLRSERATADEQLAAARRALTDAEARRESLNRLARSYTGTFAGVKAAMQWAEQTGRAGFALVASIIRTPAELETAIEVALGSRLQNIVVETWQDAEDAIAELKRSGTGRATFLPLDTLRARAGDNRPRAGSDAVLGVAADLVAYDEHYATVVQQLLGRVLVVRDLPTARQELRQLSGGWTIVTPAGEQVNSGGAVTGGARTKESGTLRRERELRELPQQVAAAQATVDAATAAQHALDEHLTAATQAVRAAETAQQEAGRHRNARQADLDSATRQSTQATQERDWQRSRLESVARDLETLAAQTGASAMQQAEAEARAATAQEHLEALRTRQEHETNANREAQERLSSIRAAVADAEGQARAQRTLVAAHQQTLARLTQQQHDTVQRLAKHAEERTRMLTGRDTAEASHQALLQQIDALRAEIGPAEEHLHAEESRLTVLEEQEGQATAALLEHETAANRVGLEAQRAQDRRDNLLERAAADGIMLTDAEPSAAEPAVDDAASTAQRSPSELQEAIAKLRERIARLGAINPLALEEYEEAAARQQFLSNQLADLRQAENTLREVITELEAAMHAQFTQTFSAVADEFERSFNRLFGGGMARLQMVSNGNNTSSNGDGTAEAETPRAWGIEIVARPPGKRQQNLSLLSGGERALTASALLFAILTVNPSPFCLLDEVDAALDESNVGRFREALVALTHQTQFALITHNRGTIEAADTLYGVTMGDDGASRVLSLRIEEYVKSPKSEVRSS